MSRIGDDYIWLTKPPRRHTTLRWLGFAFAIPLVLAAIGMTTGGSGQPGVQGETALTAASESVPTPTRAAATKQEQPKGITRVEIEVPNQPAATSHKVALQSSRKPAPEVEPSPEPAPEQASEPTDWVNVKIREGDTLSLAFERHQLSYRDSLAISHLPEHGKRFTRGLKAGDSMRVKANDNGHVLAVDYPLDPVRTLQVRTDEDGYTAHIEEADLERRQAYAVGTIDTSFYVDALEAGLSDKLIMNLAYIFGWDIDFVLDIRSGDRFIVIYEELYREGDKIGDGKILAAEFRNQGESLRALRYTTDDGHSAYYASDGRAMKKAFIRTPLDQFRISSRFSLGRKHPILNTIRKHAGTDYAAPTGTPIKATGDGRIVHRGRRGGYGNLVEIRHNNRISTRYGHMSRFRSGLGVGSHVRQGQIIGYVGMSGLATGPHLHYEFRVNGTPKNPETVALPKAQPLPAKYKEDFQHHIKPLIAQIEALDRIKVASASDSQ